MSFAERCSADTPARSAACERLMALVGQSGIEQVRLSWCDQHGMLRGKTLMPGALPSALRNGIGMVGTIALKDTSDRTAWKVFEPGGTAGLPGFEQANNLVLLPDPDSFKLLPWAGRTGWLRCEAYFQSGEPVWLDTRRQLQKALAALDQRSMALRCGLEVEFHVYRVVGHGAALPAHEDPHQATWPGEPPEVALLHPGYELLSEAHADRCDDMLAIVRRTAQGLGLPLTSLEIELGPSQFEAVFDVTDALAAADAMVLFRNGVKQALARAGYHASFMCRPPFAQIMSSGWHLHQSVVDAESRNLMPGRNPGELLSPLGQQWLAGLLAHALAMSAIAVPTINGFERFQPNALAPQRIVWGHDNRGTMLRVVGQPGDPATHLENRLGEPMANPYLYLATQVWAGLDGLDRQLALPPPCAAPYASDAGDAGEGAEAPQRLPAHLGAALEHLQSSTIYNQGLGADFVAWYSQIKRQELQRHAEAQDSKAWQRREYFGRFWKSVVEPAECYVFRSLPWAA